MSFAYGRIILKLRGRKTIGEGDASVEKRKERENRSIVKILLVIVVCFTVAWCPYFACHVYILYNDSSYDDSQLTVAFFQLLGYSNACVNPFIYCFVNKTFRMLTLKQCSCKSGEDNEQVRWKVSFTSRKTCKISSKDTSLTSNKEFLVSE